jgi:hypothetical protein
MLITDINNLGDKRLGLEDGLAFSKERTAAMQKAKGLILDDQEELEDRDLAEGTPLEWQEFLRRLQKAAPTILVKDGAPGSLALYRPKRNDEFDPETWDPTRPDWHNAHVYVTGFPKKKLAEFSAITTTEWGVAHREIRGWRTVLINLIQQRALAYRQAVREFGEPNGARGTRWHEHLANHKGV